VTRPFPIVDEQHELLIEDSSLFCLAEEFGVRTVYLCQAWKGLMSARRMSILISVKCSEFAVIIATVRGSIVIRTAGYIACLTESSVESAAAHVRGASHCLPREHALNDIKYRNDSYATT
jgi:hypothetical protein